MESMFKKARRLLPHNVSRDLQYPYPADNNTFFRIVSKYLWKKTKWPNEARKEIHRYQSLNMKYFKLFQPVVGSVEQEEVGDISEKNVNRCKINNVLPTPRDIYAAAEVLNKTILCRFYNDEHNSFEQDQFSPRERRNSGIFEVLVLHHNGQYLYIELKSDTTSTPDYQHEFCHWKNYRQSFPKRLQPGTNKDTEKNKCFKCKDETFLESTETKDDEWSFFRCISFAIYGTQDSFSFVKEMVLQLELEEDFMEIFSELHSFSGDNTKNKLEAYVKEIQNGEKLIDIGEIYATAFMLQTNIFIWYDDIPGWQIYEEFFNKVKRPTQTTSIIVLRALKKMITGGRTITVYRLLRHEGCSCEFEKPIVKGWLREIESDVHSFANRITEREETCCPGPRHQRHSHLLKNPDQDKFVQLCELDVTLTSTLQRVTEELKSDGRRLDNIANGKGTFEQCINKEVHGTVGEEGKFRIPNEEELKETATQLGVPLYVLRPKKGWKKYMPVGAQSKKCRYYVTILMNDIDGHFDRIVSSNVICNCQKIPPKTEDESDPKGGRVWMNRTLRNIKVKNRHNPMLEFFNDKTETAVEMEEERIVPPHESIDPLEEIRQRPDMENRDIDFIRAERGSFYACLSKEIFGNERYQDFIRRKIQNEIEQNKSIYGTFIVGPTENKEDFINVHLEGLKMGFKTEEVDIFAAATFFQTPIYVLVPTAVGKSHWKEYTSLRKIPRPDTMPTKQSICRIENTWEKYRVTLLQHSPDGYRRIVPRFVVCNCQLDPPVCPGVEEIKCVATSQQELKYTETYRDLKKCIENVNINLELWKSVHDKVQDNSKTAVEELKKIEVNVSNQKIFGTATGVVGGIALLAAPFTAGFSLLVAGGVTAGVGTAVVARAEFQEDKKIKKAVEELFTVLQLFDHITDLLKNAIIDFDKAAKQTHLLMEKNLQTGFAVPQIHEGKGFIRTTFMLNIARGIPAINLVKRFATSALRKSVGVVIGGGAILFDLKNIYSAIKTRRNQGKTKFTEEIEKRMRVLEFTMTRVRTWAYGFP